MIVLRTLAPAAALALAVLLPLSRAQQFVGTNMFTNYTIPTATIDPGFIYTPTYLPTAPDTRTDCVRYVNYDNSTYNLNSCKWIAWLNEVTTANFLSWNPSLNSDLSACAMQPGYSYCAILNSSYSEYFFCDPAPLSSSSLNAFLFLP